VYLHNLTTILADPVPAERSATDKDSSVKLGQLNYSIAEQPVTMHELLLQKSDGTLELLVWNERVKGADDVTVHLGRVCPSVKVYDPTIGTDAVQTASGIDSLKLTCSDHPLIIAIARK
jgi:hypothetical protein